VATTDLTATTFDDTVTDNDIVLVDFWASWCPPCRMFAPIYHSASDQHTDIVFGSVNTEQEPELSARFGITSIPTLMAFRGQVLLYQQAGALPASALEKLIAQVRAVDMDKVREEIAAETAR
jgi:thioredoxin 1